MPTAFAIQFDPGHENGYLPGSWISGRVVLTLSKPLRTRGLRLKFKGYEFTLFGKTVSFNHLFDDDITLVGFQKGESVSNSLLAELPAGNSVYPFRIQVPNIPLPASISFDHFFARYIIYAYIDIVWWFDKHSPQYPVKINQICTINSPELIQPITVNQDQVMGCFNNQGVISMICSIAKQGYLPGETIVINSEITNNSKKTKILSVNVILRQVCTIKLKYREVYVTVFDRMVCNMDIQTSLQPGSPETGFQHRITLPSNVACSSSNGKLIKVSYFVSVQLIKDGCGRDFVTNIPVLIGNSSFDNHQPALMPSIATPAFQHTIDQAQHPQQLDSDLPP
jgi:hypothetical protein